MADIDEVLRAQRAGQTPPADQRQWVVIEVLSGEWNGTVHNLSFAEALRLLLRAAIDLHSRSAPRENGNLQ